jgi:hypothetical protein
MSALLAAMSGSPVGGIIGLVIWVLIMVVIYRIAVSKGRSPVLWVVLGFFFSLITLIVIAVLPSKTTGAV